ncbi:MAG: molybdopterin synthase sulfur carrier subunit [Actinomycetales bacterium]|nr:molybdopterin synthase sulfur carrier subunit [Actinomycetales bacterium]
MAVVVRLPQALAVDAGGHRTLEFDLPAGSVLADLLTQVRSQYPALGRRICDETGAIRRFVNVYVGDDESRALQGLGTPVAQDADVFVVGSVAGG